MPKRLLTGTLDEQCAFLYNVAQEKMAAGNYTGAIHALKEILKHAPDYPGAAQLMEQAQRGKRQAGLLLWGSFAGAVVAVFIGTLTQVPNDLWLLALALLGALLGFLVGNAIVLLRRRTSAAHAESPPATLPRSEPD